MLQKSTLKDDSTWLPTKQSHLSVLPIASPGSLSQITRACQIIQSNPITKRMVAQNHSETRPASKHDDRGHDRERIVYYIYEGRIDLHTRQGVEQKSTTSLSSSIVATSTSPGYRINYIIGPWSTFRADRTASLSEEERDRFHYSRFLVLSALFISVVDGGAGAETFIRGHRDSRGLPRNQNEHLPRLFSYVPRL